MLWTSAPSGASYRSRAVEGGRIEATAACADLTELIDIRPGVRSGKPCFVGMRLAVYDVLDSMASGMTLEEIVGDFTERHVRAGLEFAALRERRLATPA